MAVKESYVELATSFKTNKDEVSFTKLYEKMKPRMKTYINSFVKDSLATDDLLSDTFTKVFTEIDKFDPQKGQITTWSFKIAKNNCLAYIKKKKKFTSLDYFLDKGIAPTTENKFAINMSYEMDDVKSEEDFLNEQSETDLLVKFSHESIEELNPLYKEIIRDRIMNKMDYKSIMYKHDLQINDFEEKFAKKEVTRTVYNKEYKRALQRIKNRIKRGRANLAKLVTEKFQAEQNRDI